MCPPAARTTAAPHCKPPQERPKTFAESCAPRQFEQLQRHIASHQRNDQKHMQDTVLPRGLNNRSATLQATTGTTKKHLQDSVLTRSSNSCSATMQATTGTTLHICRILCSPAIWTAATPAASCLGKALRRSRDPVQTSCACASLGHLLHARICVGTNACVGYRVCSNVVRRTSVCVYAHERALGTCYMRAFV